MLKMKKEMVGWMKVSESGGKKMVGPGKTSVQGWRCLGERAVSFLFRLFNTKLESQRMFEEWRRSVLLLIFKSKDVQRNKMVEEPNIENMGNSS